MPPEAIDVLDYWFGEFGGHNAAEEGLYQSRARLWFGSDDAVDEEIRERFLPLIDRATSGQLDVSLTSVTTFMIILTRALSHHGKLRACRRRGRRARRCSACRWWWCSTSSPAMPSGARPACSRTMTEPSQSPSSSALTPAAARQPAVSAALRSPAPHPGPHIDTPLPS